MCLTRWQKLIYAANTTVIKKSRLVPDARDHDKTVLLLAEKVSAKALYEIKPDGDTEEQGALSNVAPCSFGIMTVGSDLA